MAEDRVLPYGSPLPASWLAAIQEFIGSAALNFSLTLASSSVVQVEAGVNSAQVGLGIDGLFRYITATVNSAVGGAAGTYDVFAVAGPNHFVPNPGGTPPETDSTIYAFALEVLLQGTTPTLTPTVTNYRRVGYLGWDGAKITFLTPIVGENAGADRVKPGDLIYTAALTRDGALFCDGSPYDPAVYPALFGAIGNEFGIDGGTGHPLLPDYRQRAILGAGTGGTDSLGAALTHRSIGDKGGFEQVTIAAGNLPLHTHGISGDNANVSVNAAPTNIGILGSGTFVSVNGNDAFGGGEQAAESTTTPISSVNVNAGSAARVPSISVAGNWGGDSGFHGHGISDPGHGHGVSDPWHTHSVSQSPHNHGGATLNGGFANTALVILPPFGVANIFIKV